MPKEKHFSERPIWTIVGYEDDLQTALDRLGHASTDTTKKFHRSNITKVTPLSSNWN